MTSATEQLRAGLKERGIEYKAINILVTDIQRNGPFIRVYDYCGDPEFQMCVETQCKTTEQAIEIIAATLTEVSAGNRVCPNCGCVLHADETCCPDCNAEVVAE